MPLSPWIHQEYTFRHRSACRRPAESGQECLNSEKEYIEPRKTRDQALSLWSGSTASKTLDYQRTNPAAAAGVGCHFLLQCMKVKSESEVAQSCPTPSDPMDCSLPGSSIHGIFQARVLEWDAIAFSGELTLGSIKY